MVMKIDRTVMLVCVLLWSVFLCKNSYPAETASIPAALENLNIKKGDISNWNPESDMTVYVADNLYELIDGGATPYLEKGVIKTGYQRLTGPENTIVECYIFDFGSEAKALAMFEQKKKERVNDTVKDIAYTDSIVVVSPVLGGVSSSAHSGSFCMELNVTGFHSQTLALETLDFFLGFYRNKIISR
jgi:hypothetical protein